MQGRALLHFELFFTILQVWEDFADFDKINVTYMSATISAIIKIKFITCIELFITVCTLLLKTRHFLREVKLRLEFLIFMMSSSIMASVIEIYPSP